MSKRTLESALKEALRRVENGSCMTSEIFLDPKDNIQISVKVYSFDKNLLKSKPLTGGLLINKHRKV